jgi:hypothetical protein
LRRRDRDSGSQPVGVGGGAPNGERPPFPRPTVARQARIAHGPALPEQNEEMYL